MGAPAGVISIISGGLAAGGKSSSTRKAYARGMNLLEKSVKKAKTSPAISFFEDNLEGVQTPDDDALVITLRIGNYDVKRILVDGGSSADIILVNGGSSADILFYEPYMKMGLGIDRLTKVDVPLYGFIIIPAPVEGSIELPVMAGSG